jgi:hypothetical protein
MSDPHRTRTKKPDEDETRDESPDEGIRQRLEGLVPDLLRRTVMAGMGALFSSEEGIRRMAAEFSLPKDVANYLIGQAQGGKEELMRVVAKELRSFLENLNLNDELVRLLTSISFEIRTEIRFVPNAKKLGGPKIKNRVSLLRRRRGKDPKELDQPETESEQQETGGEEQGEWVTERLFGKSDD